MARILVSGLINIETTLQVDRFPIEYSPVNYPFFGISSSVSGVGFNVAQALSQLGNEVDFISIIGQDLAGIIAREVIEKSHINGSGILSLISETPQSVILFDRDGQRQIHVDLKNIQDQSYPIDSCLSSIENCDAVILCNTNFSRPLLRFAKEEGKLIATDVHAVTSINSTFDRDFMAAADILFMSDEQLPCPVDEWLERIMATFTAQIIVVGLGAKGALLADRETDTIEQFSSVFTRPVINTVGAGDALFASFMHAYMKSQDARQSIKQALVFASYKIGANGAAAGFLNDDQLQELVYKLYN